MGFFTYWGFRKQYGEAGWDLKSILLFSKKYPIIIVNRIALFLFLMCFLTAFFYVLGTIQGFMDDTQFILLDLVVILGIFLSAASIFGFILNLALFIPGRKLRNFWGIFLYCFLVIFGGSIALAASFFIIVSGGNVS